MNTMFIMEKDKRKSCKITLHTLHHSRLYVPDTKHRSVLTETPKRFGPNAEAFLFFAAAYFIFAIA